MKTILTFLTALKGNNNRDWFQEHKAEYLAAKDQFEGFFNHIIPQIRKFDPDIGTITAKECVFRIYRDVRFSKDKSPYKTNMGGFIVPGGRKSGKAGYYLHIDPEGSFIAGGMYMPPNDMLKKIRQEIVYNTKDYKKIIYKESFVKAFGSVEGRKINTPTQGFPCGF